MFHTSGGSFCMVLLPAVGVAGQLDPKGAAGGESTR